MLRTSCEGWCPQCSQSQEERDVWTHGKLIVQRQVRRKCLMFPNKQEKHWEEMMKEESESSVNGQQKKEWSSPSNGRLRNQCRSSLRCSTPGSAGHADILECCELVSACANLTANVKTAWLADFNVPYDFFPKLKTT